MDDPHDSQGRHVPAPFRQAVTKFAADLGVDAQPLIDGSALELDGRKFWLMQYGNDDPGGVTVMMDVGQLPADPKAQVAMTTPLLEYHLAFPVAVHSYYGYVPQLNCLVQCTRIALDEAGDGAAAIADAIEKAMDGMRRVQEEAAAASQSTVVPPFAPFAGASAFQEVQ